jgi:hypothetical protein
MSFDPKSKAEALEGGFESRRWASNERILVIIWPRSMSHQNILPPPRSARKTVLQEEADLLFDHQT